MNLTERRSSAFQNIAAERDELKAKLEWRTDALKDAQRTKGDLHAKIWELKHKLKASQKAIRMFCDWCKTTDIMVPEEVIEAQHTALKKGRK